MRHGITSILFLPLAVAIASPAYSQSVTGGLKGGLAFADIPDFAGAIDDPTVDTRPRTGLLLGAFASIRVASRFFIQPELMYHQKGLEIADASGGPVVSEDDSEIELNYVEIPVLAVYRFSPEGRRSGYLFGGPAFGFNTSARVTGAVAGGEDEVDVDDQVKDNETSLVFGGGMLFGPFLIEGRWTEGLSAINDGDDLARDIKNRSIAVLAGVRF